MRRSPTRVGEALAADLKSTTLRLYSRAAAIAAEGGVILADTKFEFGLDADGRLLVADEVGTPDSSRYWRREDWQPGRRQVSLDKQYLRDWATDNLASWDRRPPGPELPGDVVAEARRRYVAMYEQITGQKLGGLSASGALG